MHVGRDEGMEAEKVWESWLREPHNSPRTPPEWIPVPQGGSVLNNQTLSCELHQSFPNISPDSLFMLSEVLKEKKKRILPLNVCIYLGQDDLALIQLL